MIPSLSQLPEAPLSLKSTPSNKQTKNVIAVVIIINFLSEASLLTSKQILEWSSVPKAAIKSLDLARTPLETLV